MQTAALQSVRSCLRRVRRDGALEVHERVDLRSWTQLRVGGTADLLLRCLTADALREAMDLLASHGVNWVVLSSGSSIVPPDVGLRVPVLSLSGELTSVAVDGSTVTVGAAAPIALLRRALQRAGLSEPTGRFDAVGSLGGSLAREARSGSQWRVNGLVTVEMVHPGRDPVAVEASEYRASGLGRGGRRSVLTRLSLRLSPATSTPGSAPAHPTMAYPGGAPAFLDLADARATEVLAGAGVRGLRVGDVRQHEHDPNIVIGGGRARAKDLRRLVETMAARVAERVGVELPLRLDFLDDQGARCGA